MMADDDCVPGCPRRIEDTDDGHWRCAECGAQCLCYPSAPMRLLTGGSPAETIKPSTTTESAYEPDANRRAEFCDRCDKPAEMVVKCYLGCIHNQCVGCARQTQQERNDEIDYDREIGYL